MEWVAALLPDHNVGLDDSLEPSNLTTAGLLKLGHLLHVASNEVPIWRTRNSSRFGEIDGNGILFYQFAVYLDVLLRTKVSYKFGTESWPLTLVVSVEDDNMHYSYTPRSDFSVWTHNLPRLIVEVCSDTTHHNDRTRMLLQGASAVRLANRTLTDKERKFVLMAIYFTEGGFAERYFLYQVKDSSKVHYVQDFKFDMSNKVERFQLAKQLYNFAFCLKDADADKFSGVASKIEEINASIRQNEWPAFYTRKSTKRARTDGDEGRSTTGQGGTGGGSGAQEEFEAEGYELVPDRFESGGTWEPLYKLPPHIRTVRRVGDSSRTEFIAKRISDKSNELKILEFLRTIKPPSEHIITLLKTIRTSLGKYLIFPKRSSIDEELEFHADGGVLRSRFIQLSRNLAKELAFLHEHGVAHLDIKFANLVYAVSFRLQIIDFDIAVRVKDADHEIDKYCSSRGWIAPEIREENGPRTMYSPIRADRWSCSRVFYLFAERMRRNGDKDEGLMAFATQLMDKNPRHRPSLTEWSEPSNAPPYGVGNRLEDKQERPETCRVADKSMIPAKRRKVDTVDTDGVSANVNTNDVARPISTYA
ncbi:kinase-like protein [Laetiporus sulphureus 93-53]|uniref:Kinase-like protein n=1 Tax=Laetiporus sulphureus 93-53 TaxID=1314785 RepID=A0A165HN53_9APHY|nr:kinase-like protein [Laetiporus sulphureus 93-53]KZT11955.1 kinase-like protein [Laetiporus sulphureus 93-53]